MARKKVLSIALATMMAVSTLYGDTPALYDSILAKAQPTVTFDQETEVTEDAKQVNAANYGLCDNTKDGVILHAFCWSFNTIKENMADIAEAGYTTVQTSPINQCLEGEGGGMQLFGNGKWYYHYQPTDWKIGNYQLGSRDEYKAMCAEADKYGVRIISDVLPNHTTPTLNAVAQDLKNAAGGNLYHARGFSEIGNYSDRAECTLGQMGGLPDVNTENQGFQEYYLKFCNDVIDCGGDGFRYDTAKHIGVPSDPIDAANTRGVNDFWPVASGQQAVNGVSLKNKDDLYIYGEVLMDNGIPYAEYAQYMDMTNSGYGYTLRGNIGSKKFNAGSMSNWGHPFADKTVTWVESHDTYCNEHESAWMSDWDIRMCWAVIAARGTGTPLFFSRPDGSNGSSGNYWGNNKIGAKGNDQFKHPEVAAVNRFRNAMVGESEYMSNYNGDQCLIIERGTKGAVIINMGSDVANVKLSKVADGTYTEEVSGSTVQVSGGTLNYTVPGGTVAVVYDASVGPVTKDPTVSASLASGSTFTSPFDLTLTAKNAENVTYETSEGEKGSFASGSEKVSIGASSSVGDTVTVKVTATGGEGTTDFSETFTYKMVEMPAYKMYIRAKKSDFSSAPNAYVYSEGASVKTYNGEWPGAAMKEDGDYYVFTSTEVDSAKVIFSYDSTQDPGAKEPGYDVTGYMEYDKSAKKVSAFTPVVATKQPVTPTVTATPKVDTTKTPTKTDAPANKETISVSVADGSEFKDETLSVKITVDGAASYSVDNGPVKSFNGSATAVLGQGKIADSDVTLKVTAGNDTKTFTYHKVFDADKIQVKTAATARIQSLFEVVEDAAQVDGEAETEGFYATNPDKQVGKEKTITIDGDMSDWSDDMLIAQGAAWDIANNFKGGHENCVLDDYALYAAWDDENLYVAWQMVNTTDTWANSGDGPLSDGGRVLDVPLMLAINVGNRPAMTGKMANGKLIWDALDVSFETRVDNILLMSGKVGLGTPGYFIAADETGGASYDADYCLSFAKEGISYKMAEGCLPKTIMGLVDAKDVSDVYDTSKYVDMMSKGHDTSYDSFYEINIPLKTLGIDKSYIEENGIGVMQIATRGTSGIDCLPHDPSMLDNATGDCAVDPSTSHEKDDQDIITVPLAAVGNINAGGNGSGGTVTLKTPTPTVTETPSGTDATKAPATVKPIENTKETEAPTGTKTPGGSTNDKFTVNFGADCSAPQYTSTDLVLKAVGYPESAKNKYEFYVDGTSVQASSTTDSYTWKNGTAGAHKIKVVVTNESGDKISLEKDYVLEAQDGDNSNNNVPQINTSSTRTPHNTVAPTSPSNVNVGSNTTNTPAATNATQETPKVSATPNANNNSNVANKNNLSVSLDTDKQQPQKCGTAIALKLNATGGIAPYKYSIKIENKSGNVQTLLSDSTQSEVTWRPSTQGTYKIYGIVSDANNDIETTTVSYTITSSLKISKFKVNKTTVKRGKSLKITALATSDSTVKYKMVAKKSGSSKAILLKGYNTKRAILWKPSKTGKYTLYLTVKDAAGATKTVHLAKKITVR